MLQISSIQSPLLVHKTGHDPQVKTNKSPFYTNHPALDQILTSETTAVISGYTCDRLLLWDFQPLKIVNSLSSPAHKHMRIRQRHLNWKLQSLGVWISFQFRWIGRSEKNSYTPFWVSRLSRVDEHSNFLFVGYSLTDCWWRHDQVFLFSMLCFL